MKLFISFILGFLLALTLIGIYTYTVGSKIDKILSILEKPVSCQLPYGITDQIDTMYNTLSSNTTCVDK